MLCKQNIFNASFSRQLAKIYRYCLILCDCQETHAASFIRCFCSFYVYKLQSVLAFRAPVSTKTVCMFIGIQKQVQLDLVGELDVTPVVRFL